MPKRLRIAIFEPSRRVPGGGQIEMANTARYLSTKHDVTIFTQVPPESTLDFGSCKFKYIWPHNQYLAPWAFKYKKINKADFDLIIAGGFPGNLAALNNPDIPSLHICHAPPRWFYDLKEHFMQNSGLKGKAFVIFKNIMFKNIDRRAAKHNKIILGISKEIKRRIEKYYGRDDARIFYPGVDARKYKPGKYTNYVVSVCRLVSTKRPKMIIEAMKHVKSNVQLVMIGGGDMKDELQQLVDCPDTNANVVILGHIDEDRLLALYSSCLAAIYVPINEDYGYAPVEAAMASKATIGSNEGGLKETIIDGKTGFLIDDVSPIKIAEKIDLLAKNKKLAEKLGRNAYKHCQKFRLERTFKVLDKAIAEIMVDAQDIFTERSFNDYDDDWDKNFGYDYDIIKSYLEGNKK